MWYTIGREEPETRRGILLASAWNDEPGDNSLSGGSESATGFARTNSHTQDFLLLGSRQ